MKTIAVNALESTGEQFYVSVSDWCSFVARDQGEGGLWKGAISATYAHYQIVLFFLSCFLYVYDTNFFLHPHNQAQPPNQFTIQPRHTHNTQIHALTA